MSDFGQLGLDIAQLMIPIILAGLGWASARLTKWIHVKAKNEMIGGMLARLNDAVYTAVKNVGQTMKAEIIAAKDPKSDGGTKITEEEADKLKKTAMTQVKSYFGMKGLKELGTVLGLGGGEVEGMILDKIEAAVHDVKADAANPR